MKDKKNFEIPELIIISFSKNDDIITTSNYTPYDPDTDYWQD